VPVPAAVVTTVNIQRKGGGLQGVARIPVIAGGSGSLLDFKFKLGKTSSYRGRRVGYLEARCPTGAMILKASALFRNETHTPGVAATTMPKGSLVVPCT
jgi:hypothetical protein